MDDLEAIENYDAAGDRNRGRLGGVHWPDIALDEDNLVLLAQGILDTRIDWEKLAFGEAFDADECREEVIEAMRTDEIRGRFAPEGVFVRAAFTVRVDLVDSEEGVEREPDESVAFYVEAEFCLSFVARRHTRPFIDFMGGHVRRIGDGEITAIDPFSRELSPAEAVEWGLNGTGEG